MSTGAGAAQRSGAGYVGTGPLRAGRVVRPLPPRALTDTPPAGPVRIAALAALCLFASLQWIRQLEPLDRGAAFSWTLIAVGLAVVLIGARALPRRAGVPLAVALAIATFAAILLACGVPLALLRPRAWDELFSGIGQGLSALPDLRVPYRGVDEWVRVVVLGGGALLACLAAVLACRPGNGRPYTAALALGVLYAVPVVERGPQRPFLNGAVFAILLAALLWGDRLRIAQLPLAGTLGLAAVTFGLIVAPRLDASEPWLDYQHLADGLSKSSSVHFDWSHRYTPIDWPRRGRETLRVKSRGSAYWKGASLERFDGVHWRQYGPPAPAANDTEMTAAHPEWRQQITVVAKDISSRELYAPGDVIGVEGLGRPTAPSNGGTRVIPHGEKPLKPGDSYKAEVYVPKPTVREMRISGRGYPLWLRSETTIDLPPEVGGPELPTLGSPGERGAVVTVPFFGDGGPIPMAPRGAPYTYAGGRQALLDSDYAPVYRLARQLAAGAATPYDVVQRVLRRVRGGARYTEDPPAARLPLMDFLFGEQAGYCQQFSGAMALLLRMVGIPARVAAGFAPGLFDEERDEHVVRDYDAHSWVEVYFPQMGWVAFDPTPSSAPPASQASDIAPSAASGDSSDRGGDRPAERSHPTAGGDDGGASRLLIGLGVTVLFMTAAALILVGHRRIGTDDGPPELAELRRALKLTGRESGATTTLQTIETGFAGDREAQDYVRALRLQRYAGAPGGPTVAQRAALRRALGAGLGVRGRVRALLALPPHGVELRDRALRRRSYTA